MSPREAIGWLRHELRVRKRRFLADLDAERISSFQSFYYPMIMVAGLYCGFGADAPTAALADTLGRPVYLGWLCLNIACPMSTLLGRRLYAKAATAQPGQPNPAAGAAAMQLVGDGGVWGAILIYFGCFVNTFYWGQGIYPTFFFLMGIPGGFMFTLRSWRRWRQIRSIEKLL